MRSFSFDAMIPQLLFVTGNGSSREIEERIKVVSQNPAYTEIFLSHVPVDDEILLQGLRKRLTAKKWDGVHLSQCIGKMIPELIQICAPLVEKFSIMGDFQCMDEAAARAISDALRRSRIKKLLLRVQLSLDLADALYEATISESCNLQELILTISRACDASMERLSAALGRCRTLKSLRLNRNDLTWTMDEHQIETLMTALKAHPSLQELSIQGSSCTERGMAAICEHVLPTLRRLDLSNHRIGGDALCGLPSLALALSGSNVLKSLSLSGHSLTRTETTSLVDAMIVSGGGCQLEDLQLNKCNLDDDSVTILGNRLLPKMHSLAVLQLRDNPFGPAGLQALLQGASQNYELEQMVLPTTATTTTRNTTDVATIGDEMERIKTRIYYHLALNRAGRRLLRVPHHTHENNKNGRKTTIPLSVWPVLLSRVREALECDYSSHGNNGVHCSDAIYHLLHGPALLQRR